MQKRKNYLKLNREKRKIGKDFFLISAFINSEGKERLIKLRKLSKKEILNYKEKRKLERKKNLELKKIEVLMKFDKREVKKNMDKKGYKKYEEIRNELGKLMDKYGVTETIEAMENCIQDIKKEEPIRTIRERE